MKHPFEVGSSCRALPRNHASRAQEMLCQTSSSFEDPGQLLYNTYTPFRLIFNMEKHMQHEIGLIHHLYEIKDLRNSGGHTCSYLGLQGKL